MAVRLSALSHLVGFVVASRAIRRWQAYSHMMRRALEDRNQHYRNLTRACYRPGKAMARFKEQPQVCSGPCCGNPRRWFDGAERLTMQERRHLA